AVLLSIKIKTTKFKKSKQRIGTSAPDLLTRIHQDGIFQRRQSQQAFQKDAYPAKAGTEGAINERLGSQVRLRRSTANVE
ncbi:MAG: hypothetical protein LWW82_02060, partial [Comamonadaceae bacterium]|nr:hypothetical protein [Comamonadaceae bacterium]